MSTSSHLFRTASITYQRNLLSILIISISLHHTRLTFAQLPADHLVPPPPPLPPSPVQSLPFSSAPLLPFPQALTHNRPHDYSKRFESFPIPLHAEEAQVHTRPNIENSGLMTRLARWFGFDGSPKEQQLLAASFKQPAYIYPRPQDQFIHNSKENCNLCNKYPWIPMLPLSVQYPPAQQHPLPYQQTHWNQQQAQASIHAPFFLPGVKTQQQQVPLKQRAVQFNFPQPYFDDISKLKPNAEFHGKTPVHPASSQPILSGNELPSAFDAPPFRAQTSTFTPINEQQLPTTNAAYFTENIAEHSELKPDLVIPTQIPPTVVASPDSANVEIIKSHQLTEFVSSIEYPATFVQSQSFDVAPISQTEMPINHKPDTETPTSTPTVTYQYESVQPHTRNHIPASQLLTDPGNLAERSTLGLIKTTFAPNQEISQDYSDKIVVPITTNAYNLELNPSGDNFPSASSHNNQNSIHLQANEIYTTTQFPNEGSFSVDAHSISQNSYQSTPSSPSFVPSINQKINTKDRGTPKRLLDSPIQHLSNNLSGSPRPFTRDPSELDFRLGFLSKPQQNHQQSQSTVAPWVPTITPAPPFSVSSAEPTPTSTYGAVDAAGHYAGISPPAIPIPVVSVPAKTVQQIIVPYTTKSRPRPFESTHHRKESVTKTPTDKRGDSFSQNVDLHEQQESMVVISTASKLPLGPITTTRTPYTTKYITKVLASNLRELLRREQALKNHSNSEPSIDLKRLQKNIDDWTEQEYTSLSHRPSTPTIRGRSKHIPVEYLTTTTTTPNPVTSLFKTTPIFDATALSTSINNLESLKAPDRGFKRFEYPPIEYNLINDADSLVTQATTTTTTSSTPTTTKRPSVNILSDKYTTPIYMRSITTQPSSEVLWQKARILISPETKEKVYVVTPQPRFLPHQFMSTSTQAPLQGSVIKQQKPPRFSVRPTPGKGSLNNAKNSSKVLYAPEPFGLKGLSAFVPAEPVEIIGGNSRVGTTVTPSAKQELESDHNYTWSRSIRTDYVTIKRNSTKPTMSPSPR